MVSLWGSNNNDQQDTEEPENGRTSHETEPTETTRLIQRRPPPPHADGYLDPDDPAVSPYNLWTVRFLRYLTVLFLFISFFWWVLLFVSIFVSPPMMHSRGSGFFDFSFTTLTVGNLLIALLFFANPSKAMRVLTFVLAGLLLLDMILILAVGRVRMEEGWVGIASVVWAVFIAIFTALTDRVVAWGKREEEERLTGRPETRRTLAEWLGVMISTIFLSLYVAIVVLMTATLILRARDASLEMEGSRIFVDGEKYQVHLACVGNVTTGKGGKRGPTILLEGGEEPVEQSFERWAYGAYTNGTIDRYCYWDRPGYAWSDDAPSPHSAGMSATALSEALAKSGEDGPWISVSAGYGSIVSRIFSSQHAGAVEGILLVDPLHEDLLHRIGQPSRGFVLWGYGILSPLGIQRTAGALFKGRSREDRVYGKSAYQGGKMIKAQLQENLVADSLTKNEVFSARQIQEKKTPLAVISSGLACNADKEWAHKQEDIKKITDNLVASDIISKAPHQVWKTFEGREAMEKALSKLVKAAKK
ncbi:putative membrane protein [Venturia nashicola]|uniref:Putative membrane protein n=1 Tax=Venturia nashicola TaxID=86259 RepID=A0A4Z1NT97_9PEZI|nr:putative membrane protein [Venturia nashicola]